jgi:uncharacterized protein DUF4403
MQPHSRQVPWVNPWANFWAKIAGGAVLVVVSFVSAVWAMTLFWPATGERRPASVDVPPVREAGALPVARDRAEQRPALVEVPPLKPVVRSSTIVAPVAIALTAIGDALEKNAPRDVSGRRDSPMREMRDLMSNSEVGWTVARGPLAVSGRSDALAVSTPLNGTFRVTGQLSGQAGDLAGMIGNMLGGNLGRDVQNLATKPFDQRAEIKGNITVTARPALKPTWRIEPNLAAQVALADASTNILGMRLNISNEVKPLLDRNVNEQVAALQARVRDDPFMEIAARREWAKMCRSIPLGAAAAGTPNLWLELKPTRAFAAQPGVNESALTLTVGVQAETRIVPNETKPECPFPAELELVPQIEQGKIAVAVPADIPFTEVNRLLEAQLKGKTFPEDKSSAFAATVRNVELAASGDRLLISLRVKANEAKSWFGLGAEATVHVWGRPVLDSGRQVLRLEDVKLDVESEAAFGLLGTAARAAVPYLEKTLADNAVVDLLPLATNARKSIESAIDDFRKTADGVRVDAAITSVRLTGIEFDAKTLRVIAEADGTVKVAVTALP